MSDNAYQKNKKNSSRPKAADKGRYSGLQKRYGRTKKEEIALKTKPMF